MTLPLRVEALRASMISFTCFPRSYHFLYLFPSKGRDKKWVYFLDNGGLFLAHTIVVSANKDGQFERAALAG